jgi:uncharacterized protein
VSEFLGHSLNNLLSPMILFFVLGWLSVLGKSHLELPESMVRAMAYYLLAAIGLKGGIELAHEGWTITVVLTCVAGVLLGLLLPIIAFAILRWLGRFSALDAAAIAAHYGSVSAVTFLTTAAFLTRQGYTYEGYTVAMMAVMESPAIAIGLLLARLSDRTSTDHDEGGQTWEIIRESLFNSSVVVLMGGLIIGAITGDTAHEAVGPFFFTLFQGVLCLFLLHMGIEAAQRFSQFREVGPFLTGFGLTMPLIGAAFGLLTGWALGFSVGGITLVAILGASASYIAVPAAMHLALPRANQAYSMTLALGITFPFNIIIGIPLYFWVARLIA